MAQLGERRSGTQSPKHANPDMMRAAMALLTNPLGPKARTPRAPGGITMLPFRPTPFFADKNRAFWRLQAIGWSGAMVLRSATAFANDRPLDFLVLVLIATITGFSISLVLSVVFGQLINRRPFITWGATTLVLAAAVVVSAMINAWTISLYQGGSEASFPSLVLGVFYLDMTLLGAWSALYYAINFFLQVEEQNDRLERLEAQATSAQLAMLRYQLNPHFLFNTLNAISTLVLEQDGKQANSMLTQLSAFLRYSLDSDPLQKTSLAEEIRALKLYLEIEKTRFGDRLEVNFDVDDDVVDARVPSLILQPAIENAIKYAIAQMESGGVITITAKRKGNMLCMEVCDNGPSAPDNPSELLRQATTGVGLVNMRDRLRYLYQDRSEFNLNRVDPTGLCVCLRIPFETRG